MDATLEKISQYAASLSQADITPEAMHCVKRSLVDSVGCALGAFAAGPVKMARRMAAHVSSDMPASVIGTLIKSSPEMAGFANGVAVRYLDFSDDYLNKDGPHPSDNISPILAVAESLHADGKTLSLGMVLAYEVVDHLVDSAPFKLNGWDYVTETSIGSALGVGKVMGLSQAQLANAVALAIAPNIALRQTRSGQISMWKGCAGPNGGRNGLFAALLAAEGMTGPDEPFEGRHGLWNQVTGKFELEPFGGKGRKFKIEETFFKFRPVVYTALLPVEAAIEMRKKVDVDRIASITLFVDKFILTSNQPEHWDPLTRETADHSLPYLVVAALLDGEITEETYTPKRFRDPRALALLKKLKLEEDPAYTKTFPKTFTCRLEVTDTSGKKVVQEMKNPKGHPDNPMSDADIEAKFMELTGSTLSPEQARAALDLMWHLEKVKDVSSILDAVVV